MISANRRSTEKRALPMMEAASAGSLGFEEVIPFIAQNSGDHFPKLKVIFGDQDRFHF